MIFIYMKHPIDALKGGNFCIFRLKITEKEGKTDRERDTQRAIELATFVLTSSAGEEEIIISYLISTFVV